MRSFAVTVLALAGTAGCTDDGDRARYDAAWQATLDEVSARAEALGIPGVGVAVVIDGALAYSGGVGVRSRTTGEPVTGDTLFRSSSAASKPAIAVALLDLAEEGRLDLHAPVGDVVPEIELDPAYSDEIDLDALLLQRAGLAVVDYRLECTPRSADVIEFYEHAGTLGSFAPPGAVWSYTAHGSYAGAAALQAVERRPFTEVLEERVLVPAGMETATYDLAEAAQADHAVGHLGADEVGPADAAGYTCGEWIASTGLYASAADHGRFVEVLLTPGRVLEQASLDELQGAEHDPGFGAPWSYGYQVYGLEYKGARVFHHYGSSEGYTAGISWIPELGFGVALLTNAGEGERFANVWSVEELRWWIIDRFLELSGAEPDSSTPPSTWGQYEGTFESTTDPGTSFTFALDASDRLTVTIVPDHPTPIVLEQGAIDVPYQGGDLFSFIDGSRFFLVGFFPGDDGAIRYAHLYSSDSGNHFSERAP